MYYDFTDSFLTLVDSHLAHAAEHIYFFYDYPVTIRCFAHHTARDLLG